MQQRSEWGPGPWQQEPDYLHWVDQETGYDCLIVRNPVGALCGYVGLKPSHRFYEVNYNSLSALDVHGGLTYSNYCWGDICHKTDHEGPKVWWLGFDCSHAFDLSPATEALGASSKIKQIHAAFGYDQAYRDIDYVKSEIKKLARQLK